MADVVRLKNWKKYLSDERSPATSTVAVFVHVECEPADTKEDSEWLDVDDVHKARRAKKKPKVKLAAIWLLLLLLISSAAAANLPTPEDYGAIGDGKANDYVALHEWANRWAVKDLNSSVALELTAGKTYATPQPLVFTCGATKNNFKLVLRGNGARLLYTGGKGRGYAFRFGDLDREKKGFFCHISDVNFEVSRDGSDGCLLLDNADFSQWDTIRASGHCEEAVVKIRNHNSLTLTNFNVGGGDINVLAGPNVNVFSWTGGRVQQGRIGLHYRGSVFCVNAVDFSLLSEAAIVLDRAEKGRVHLYTERIGPKTRGNDAACVRVNGCRNIHLSGSLNCANGPIVSGTHAGYGADIQGSQDVVIEANGYCPQRAYVRADSTSRNVIIEGNSESQVGDTAFATAMPVQFADGLCLINRSALRLTDSSPSLLPGLDAWQGQLGATAAPGTITLPFAAHPHVSRFVSPQITVLPGTYRLEARFRLLEFLQPDISQRTADMAVLFMQLQVGSQRARCSSRIGDGWQDVWCEVTSQSGGRLQVHLGLPPNYEPLRAGVEFFRVRKV